MPDKYPAIDYIGLEFETDVIKDSLPAKLTRYFKQTRDASIETPVKVSNGILLKDSNLVTTIINPNDMKFVLGTEFVSVPVIPDDLFFMAIQQLTYFLQDRGEDYKSNRSGIHIHVSVPATNLRILKSILRVGRFLEDLFFTIGGNGYNYRGEITDGIYCRPITKFGPPCVSIRNTESHCQIFDIEDCLAVETYDAFWNRFGSISLTDEIFPYHPTRYVWLNLYSLIKHNTVEYRIFNKTLNPFYIFAEIKFCQEITRFMLDSDFSTLLKLNMLKENSIYDLRSKNDIIKTFEFICNIIQFNKEYKETLMDILMRTPTPIIKPGYVFSHLRYTLGGRNYLPLWGKTIYHPSIIPMDDIRKPIYTDIHNYRG